MCYADFFARFNANTTGIGSIACIDYCIQEPVTTWSHSKPLFRSCRDNLLLFFRKSLKKSLPLSALRTPFQKDCQKLSLSCRRPSIRHKVYFIRCSPSSCLRSVRYFCTLKKEDVLCRLFARFNANTTGIG